jgi:DNA-binding GntR family transcriptional regulator
MTTRSRSSSGYSTWRLIAEELRGEIAGGARAPGAKLPSEGELAERFGVHRIGARHATAAEAADLGLPPGAVVLVTRSLDPLTDGTPLQIDTTRFVADGVQLDIGHADLELDGEA